MCLGHSDTPVGGHAKQVTVSCNNAQSDFI